MKVLGIVCSPREGGNTEIMMEEALAGAKSQGAETELWTTAGKELKPCDACSTCLKQDGKCHIEDDMQALYPKILAAEGIIFGSPAYFGFMTAQAKTVVDRLFCLATTDKLKNKVAGVISTAGAVGHQGVWIQFSHIIPHCRMLIADYAFGFALAKGDVRKDKFAMKSSEELGKQVVSLINKQFRYPEEYDRPLYRVCREQYGVDSYPLKRFDK